MIPRIIKDLLLLSITLTPDGFIQAISTSNHMFGMAIWGKFSTITSVTYPKNCPNQTCDYWLITLNQQTLSIETNIF